MSAPGAPAAIEAHGLSKRFAAVRAVADLSFTVPRGSVTGLVGPRGSGKTTTLRMLLGLVRPDAGTALVLGRPLAALPDPAGTLGAVLDTAGAHPARTVLGHLRVYAAAAGAPADRGADVLRLVGLNGVAGRKIGSLSTGVRRRLLVATALLGDPQILVLDDPTTGLEPGEAGWLREVVAAFARSGRSVLVSSRRLHDIGNTLDRLVVIGGGTLVHEGSMDRLRAEHRARLLVACSDPVRLATALGAVGVTDVRALADGRIAICGSDPAAVGRVAARTGVSVSGAAHEEADLDRVVAAMVSGQAAP